ncbi:HWE histidine kinase domain-containing protein [Microvirga solisilvae]|uniref:HWE histidine kinase domain-containing protein n=1 Tax=Microvirga solisilvae TaxID=2919498 RepID=UPI001FAFEAA8|nr:HWE histidine kinase domain-containing protein [Microvirga solisilvae]
MQAHDWSRSPLGYPETWPEALRRALNLVLPSPFPMFVAWGPELCLLYNEASIPIMGAWHPTSLGQPLKEILPETWDDLSPLVDRALAGEASYHENKPLTLGRNDYAEQTSFTFAFSPVMDDAGIIRGFLAVVTETTRQVANDRRLAFLLDMGDRLRPLTDPIEISTTAAEMLGQHLGVARAGYAEVDETQEVASVKRDWTNGTVPSLAGETRILDGFGPALAAEVRHGSTIIVADSQADPRVEPVHHVTWESIGTRSMIVVPLVKNGALKALFYLHEPVPRRWTESEATLARDVAERTWDAVERARAEFARHESESQLKLALDASHMAVWEHETASDTLRTSPELNRLLGYPPDAPLDLQEIRSRYYQNDYDHVVKTAVDALSQGDRFYEAEYRFYRTDGALRWHLMRAEMVLGEDGIPARTIGVLLDITDRKKAEQALREREAELRSALDAGSLATFVIDFITGEIKSSARLNELYAYPPGQVLTLEDLRARYHPDDHAKLVVTVRKDRENPSVRFFDWIIRLLLPDQSIRWINGRGEYIRDENGRLVMSRGVILDITERKRWEEHQQLLMNELNHRVKNTLATVQSVASQTLRNAETTDVARIAIESRLFALSRTHDVLTRENWESASIDEIIAEAIAPYRHERENRLFTSGPDVRVSPRMALALSMALQELATNAVKYGALSNTCGKVGITWSVIDNTSEPRMHLSWTESGGPHVSAPTHRGFGTRLIERSLAQDLNGKVEIQFAPSGVTCTVDAPLA